jgi:hypothetical protein
VSAAGVSILAMVPHGGTEAARNTLRPPAADATGANDSKPVTTIPGEQRAPV